MLSWLKKFVSASKAPHVADFTAATNSPAPTLPPDESHVYKELGDTHFGEGQLEDAVQRYRQAISIKPNFAEVYNNLGNALKAQGRYEEAEHSLKRAIFIKPELTNAYYNLSSLLQQQNRWEEAIANLNKALELKPNMELFYRDLSDALFKSGQHEAAKLVIAKGLSINPNYADFHFFLGYLYWHENNFDEAIAYYQRALSIQPDHAHACFGLGTIFVLQHKHKEGIAFLKQTFELDSEYYIAQSLISYQLQQFCEWDDLNELAQFVRRSVLESPPSEKNHHTPLSFLLLPGTTAKEQKLCAENYTQLEYQHLVAARDKLGFGFDRPPNEKIHIGYLSGDFRQHAVSFQIAEIFELHDRSRFHITAYSFGQDDGSAMRSRLEKAFDNFVDICNDSHEEAARKIHGDHTDILVDLAGHTRDSRSEILALRPAPIQVNYLGYPGTMGADFIDYIIADRFVIPLAHRDYYTESVVRLPDCLMPTDRTRARLAAPSRMDCGLPEKSFVFCCFNQTYKITSEMFDIWCRLLKAVPGSVLWLPASNPQAEINLRKEAENRSVNSGRIIMASRLPEMEDHLARLQCADLFLDTLPYNAHSTCCDALWMGLPVVTCAGETFPSRVAGSLLTAIGVPELITYNLNNYYHLALELATNRESLAAIRRKIIANRDTAPLFDSELFTRNLEQVYLKIIDECTPVK